MATPEEGRTRGDIGKTFKSLSGTGDVDSHGVRFSLPTGDLHLFFEGHRKYNNTFKKQNIPGTNQARVSRYAVH